MKLYGYYNDNGEIRQAQVEVKEKVILVPEKDGQSIPFLCEKSIDRDKIGELIGWNSTIFYKKPSFQMAKEKFLEKAQKEYLASQNENKMKCYIVGRLEKAVDKFERIVKEKSHDN